MKNWFGFVVVVLVAAAVGISVVALVRARTASSERRLCAVEESVRELRGEVANLAEAVGTPRELPPADSSHETPPKDDATAGDVPSEQTPDMGDVNVEPVDIVLEVNAAGECTLDGREVGRDELGVELKSVLEANPAMTLVVRAAETVPMSDVNQLLEEARQAGIYRVEVSAHGAEGTEDSTAPE